MCMQHVPCNMLRMQRHGYTCGARAVRVRCAVYPLRCACGARLECEDVLDERVGSDRVHAHPLRLLEARVARLLRRGAALRRGTALRRGAALAAWSGGEALPVVVLERGGLGGLDHPPLHRVDRHRVRHRLDQPRLRGRRLDGVRPQAVGELLELLATEDVLQGREGGREGGRCPGAGGPCMCVCMCVCMHLHWPCTRCALGHRGVGTRLEGAR